MPATPPRSSERHDRTTDLPFELLPPAQRRRLVVLAFARSSAVCAILVVAYFVLPFTTLMNGGRLSSFVIGLVVVLVVLVVQFRHTVQAPYPRLRAVETLLTCASLYLVMFASAHFVLAVADADSYSQPMTRLDALYFAVTTFATVGYGDLAPRSEVARTLTLVQMVTGLVLVSIIARLLLGLAQHRTTWRTSSATDAENGPVSPPE